MRQIKFLLIPAIVILFIFVGCSNQATEPDSTKNNPENNSMPPLAQKLINQHALDETDLETYTKLFGLDTIPNDYLTDCDVYAVTFLWGHFFDAPPDIETVDWTGSAGINGVAYLYPRATIDFEEGQDSIIFDDIPSNLSWVSFTNGDFDGISMLLFYKRDIIYITQPWFTFQTDPLTLQFSMYQLAHLDAFYPANNTMGVAVHSRKIWQNDCPGGLIDAQWIKSGSLSDNGTFSGLWQNHQGEPLGYLSGTFWIDDNLEGKLSGSVSGLDTDEVIAELEGTWYYDDPRLCPMCGSGHGAFSGTFVMMHNDQAGTFEGEFGDYSIPPDDEVMPMVGLWQINCPWVATDVFVQ